MKINPRHGTQTTDAECHLNLPPSAGSPLPAGRSSGVANSAETLLPSILWLLEAGLGSSRPPGLWNNSSAPATGIATGRRALGRRNHSDAAVVAWPQSVPIWTNFWSDARLLQSLRLPGVSYWRIFVRQDSRVNFAFHLYRGDSPHWIVQECD